MSGQRMDYHGSPYGNNRKDVPFPDKAQMHQISDQEGAGSVMRYEDTEEAIGHVQKESTKHLKNRPLKPGYRY